MTGIKFADFGAALAPVIAMERADEDSKYRNALLERQQRLDARDAADAPHVAAVLQGDRSALGNVSAGTAIKLAPMLERLDATKKAQAKELAEFTTQTGMAVLQTPPEQRPQAYAMAKEEARKRGYDTSAWPQQWDGKTEGWINFQVNKARPVADYFKEQGKGLDPIPGQSAPPSAAPAPNQQQFIQTITPHALEVSKATGLDPRLVIAQAALETGFGSSAPGNNYFGIKSHGAPGGQVLPTTEAGPGGSYRTQESFRTYSDAGESARDYAQFLKSNSRYAPVLGAQGLDAQIDAMGKSGYATDPNYAAKLRAIAQGIQMPGPAGMPQPPTGLAVAGNPASMPQPPAGMAILGNPAPMPSGPPGLPQGDNVVPAQADGSGNPLPPTNPREAVRGLKLPQGAVVRTINGVPVVKDGTVLITHPDGTPDFVPLPQRADPKDQQPAPGYRWNPDRSGQEYIPGGPADPGVIAKTTEAKRKADEKAIPQTVTKGVQENLNALKQLDRAEEELKKTPDSVGGPGSVLAANLPGAGLVQSRMDPEGNKLRALIADIGSMKIHERSGAAVTASEFPRLKPFVPTISDDAKTVRDKLANFRAVYEDIMRDTLSYYGPANGFREYTPAAEYLNKGQPEAKRVGGPAEAGKLLFEARDAISKGAPREAVEAELRSMGVDPSGL